MKGVSDMEDLKELQKNVRRNRKNGISFSLEKTPGVWEKCWSMRRKGYDGVCRSRHCAKRTEGISICD